jgi:hypothetical protein
LSEANEPCGNEDCDTCHPEPRWRVSRHRVQHITNVRVFKASTREKAIKIFEEGTAWPREYDDRGGAVIQLDDVVVEQLPPKTNKDLTFSRCFNSPEWKTAMEEFHRTSAHYRSQNPVSMPLATEDSDDFDDLDVAASSLPAETAEEHF